MKKMYLVQYSVGDWDSYTVNIFVTDNEELAKLYVEKFRSKLKKWKGYYAEMFGIDSDLFCLEDYAQNKYYDRFCQIMDTNNAYYLKIELR
jgi:hypothetical protein